LRNTALEDCFDKVAVVIFRENGYWWLQGEGRVELVADGALEGFMYEYSGGAWFESQSRFFRNCNVDSAPFAMPTVLLSKP
jgi:hypothetical protein